jgi:competence protein ComEC
MSPSKILFFLCLSFIAGIFLEGLVNVPQIFVWAFLFVGIVFILLGIVFCSVIPRPSVGTPTRNPENVHTLWIPAFAGMTMMGFCLMFFVFGILRMQIAEFNVVNDKLSKLNGNGKTVVLAGEISAEPDIRDTSQKLKVKVTTPGGGKSIVLVSTNRYPEYNYLDKIKISGKLETPGQVSEEEFSQSYKNYLAKDGIYSVMNFAKIKLLGNAGCNFYTRPACVIYSGILAVKKKMRESITKNFLMPESSVIRGIILGDSSAISKDLKGKLSITGISHIIAVSGTHVAILGTIIMSSLLILGLWRGQAFYFSAIFICLYIALVGLPASGVRAGIMGIIFILGEKLGRQNDTGRIIVSAGAVMLLQNPLLLLYDVGFQLSFLSVLGLIYFEPLCRKFLKFIPNENILMMFSATVSAQIFTLPIVVYNFGNISFVSLAVNILILPTVFYLMFFGFVSGVAGVFWNFAGWILSLPAFFLAKYFLFVVNIFSKPWAFTLVENVSWIWLLISYAIIISITVFLNKKYSRIF